MLNWLVSNSDLFFCKLESFNTFCIKRCLAFSLNSFSILTISLLFLFFLKVIYHTNLHHPLLSCFDFCLTNLKFISQLFLKIPNSPETRPLLKYSFSYKTALIRVNSITSKLITFEEQPTIFSFGVKIDALVLKSNLLAVISI